MKKENIKAVLFDLDGVITDTAKFHFEAWSRTAAEVGITLPHDFEENLKGIDRINSMKRILEFGNVTLSEEDFEAKLTEKNDFYVSLLSDLTKEDILPGIVEFIAECKENNIKLAIASVSKNAPVILTKLGIIDAFDYICDPATLKNGKPDPEIFVNCAEALNVPFENCVGIEDAVAGVESIKGANIFAVGIGELEKADIILKSTSELTLGLFNA